MRKENTVYAYSISMDAAELELACPCGYENCKPHPPVVNDFVACVGCKAVLRPVRRPDPPEIRPGHEMRGLGVPSLGQTPVQR